ncbi:hypothetical protein VTJ49DRAFT_6897 [Mycothermus thermophilus]|uniref:IQ calmodulin-binding motif protein n=1 Tax=Humicola insolens TaxID=85995 RepID=A0ABR3VID7_HUMIN
MANGSGSGGGSGMNPTNVAESESPQPTTSSTPQPPSPSWTTCTLPPALPPPTSSFTSTSPQRPVTRGSINSVGSSRSHQEYLDSLMVPTKEQFDHITEVQLEREAEHKRMQREKKRQSLEVATPHSSGPASSPDSPRPPHPSRPHHSHHGSRSSIFSFARRSGSGVSSGDEGNRAKAATVIQKTYRGYRVRRQLKGLDMDASTRWAHAIREARWRALTAPHPKSGSDTDGWSSPERPGTATSQGSAVHSPTARQNWKKAAAIARHAGADIDGDASSSSSSSPSLSPAPSQSGSDSSRMRKKREQDAKERLRRQEEKARLKRDAKVMHLQYFLEMVDLKHRYGANLQVYHEVWMRADTKENFFYWLDYGEGKDLDLEACPRERLEREQVRYLSREERQHYLVKVDDEGRLCWAKNGARIDTSVKFKDSIHGIVPKDDPTPAYVPPSDNTQTPLLGHVSTESSPPSRSSTSSTLSTSTTSSIDSAMAGRYTAGPGPSSTKKKISQHLSGNTILNRLLRKTIRKNTWIFVADTSFRLYVGIKDSGVFQHSSFLQGARISAAGLIRIRDGRLTSLSPLSGHYRPPASNFRAFVKSLREAGVDMSHVSLSKSYVVLAGLETYFKARKKASDAVDKVRRRGHRKKRENDELVVPEHKSDSHRELPPGQHAVDDTADTAAIATTSSGPQPRQDAVAPTDGPG